MSVTGKTIQDMGYPPGPHIPAMVDALRNGATRSELDALAPAPKRQMRNEPEPVAKFIGSETTDEADNVEKVCADMSALMRVPTIRQGAIMPDACPAGTIPVGGVVASEAIHPGLHSADICCSMFLTTFPGAGPKDVLNRIHAVTHFGPGARNDALGDHGLDLSANPFTSPLAEIAAQHLGTQGDGNHFAFVGLMDGVTTLVTHHGSRGFGASLYKSGLKAAQRHTRKVADGVPKGAEWLDPESEDGQAYWAALGLIERWTYRNHEVLHDAVGLKRGERFWNPHNFVFRKSDGLFYHAKGATPGFYGDTTIVPLNMAEPILLTRGLDAPGSMGFLPHGAGRNYSRSEHRRRGIVDDLAGIDARWWCGPPDPTEMPSAYTDAGKIRAEITARGLAEIVATIEPFGAVMAGDWEIDAPWRTKRAAAATEPKSDARDASDT